jgi:hypothetical protein
MAERTWQPSALLERRRQMDRKFGLTAGQELDATTTEARQGVAPHRLRYMLGIGIAVVVLGFLAVYFLS